MAAALLQEPVFSGKIRKIRIQRGIRTTYEDFAGFQAKWKICVLVTRVDGTRGWKKCDKLMAIFLKKWKKPVLKPFKKLTAIAVLESYEEVKALVEVGSQIIAPGEL